VTPVRAAMGGVLLAWVFASVAFGSACSSSDDTPDFPKVVSLGSGELFATILNSGIGVGQNRVLMSVIDREDNRVLDASMHVRYYSLNGSSPRLRASSEARFVPVELSYIDEQSNRAHSPAGTDGAYASYVDFDEAGDWGVEIAITRAGKKLKPILFRFNVLERSAEPAIGDAAPASVQQTLASASNIEEIDSSFPPRPGMHDTTIADALRTGQPIVVAFATPAFCQSRTCAPVMDTVMDPLAQKYAGRAVFIHVEPYVLRDLRDYNMQNIVPAMQEWGLSTEPWVFVVDRRGRVAGKFEGIMAIDEVESVLSLALETAPAAVTPEASGATN
jgi:hypothetical protein